MYLENCTLKRIDITNIKTSEDYPKWIINKPNVKECNAIHSNDTLMMRKRHSQTFGLAHVVCFANDTTADNKPYRLRAIEWLLYSRDRLLSY